MPVTLKPDPAKGWKVAKLFKVSPSLIEQANKKGIVIVSTTPGIYTVKCKTKVFGNIPVKGMVISLVEQGSLAPTSLDQYKDSFTKSLEKAIAATPDLEVTPAPEVMMHFPEDPYSPPHMPANSVGESLGELLKKKVMGTASTVQKVVPVDKGPKSPTTKLADALSIYQAVQGTNIMSTYYTFAFFPGLKLAARINGTKLSIRAEGSDLSSYAPLLKSQFKMDAAKGHASAHYLVSEGGKDLIVKTLAAIVGVIGFQKAEKVADLNQFVYGYKD